MKEKLRKHMSGNGYTRTSLDLFSGPGGIATGFRWAGICPLIAVEWTGTTAQTYAANQDADLLVLEDYLENPGILTPLLEESDRPVLILGDINEVPEELVRELLRARYGLETVDIVSGGAPCESFSYAGKRADGDPRDDLFTNIVRLARAVRPQAVVFENVKGLFSKKMKNRPETAFGYICHTFESENPPYIPASKDPSEILLKASDYGVPQDRERVILVAFREGKACPFFAYPGPVFGEATGRERVTVADAISDLPPVGPKEEAEAWREPDTWRSENQKAYVSLMRGNCPEGFNAWLPERFGGDVGDFLDSHRGPGHTEKKLRLLAEIKPGESMKSAWERLGKEGRQDELREIFPKTIYASRNRRLRENAPSFTVTSHCLDEMLHPRLDRAVTPREAARLQSFPDWYVFKGPYTVFHSSPDQDRYEQIGDAVPPLLAFAVGRAVSGALDRAGL